MCQHGRDCSFFLLKCLNALPDGRVVVANEMEETAVPSLTLVVGSGAVVDSCLMHIPDLRRIARRYTALVDPSGRCH